MEARAKASSEKGRLSLQPEENLFLDYSGESFVKLFKLNSLFCAYLVNFSMAIERKRLLRLQFGVALRVKNKLLT